MVAGGTITALDPDTRTAKLDVWVDKTEAPVSTIYSEDIAAGAVGTDELALHVERPELVVEEGSPEYIEKDVVQALRQLLTDAGIAPSDISFLAYSTTQVTNALLAIAMLGCGIWFVATQAWLPFWLLLIPPQRNTELPMPDTKAIESEAKTLD